MTLLRIQTMQSIVDSLPNAQATLNASKIGRFQIHPTPKTRDRPVYHPQVPLLIKKLIQILVDV